MIWFVIVTLLLAIFAAVCTWIDFNGSVSKLDKEREQDERISNL
jgi:hypothetical protein